MSANKRKYFLVTTEQIVSANNKTDAIAKATGARNVDATLVSTDTFAERVSAENVKAWTA